MTNIAEILGVSMTSIAQVCNVDVNTDLTFNSTSSGYDFVRSSDAVTDDDTKDGDWDKQKEITINGPLTNETFSLTIRFQMKSPNGETIYGRIYRNGGAVGTQRSTTNTSYQEWTETIAGWSEDDTIELWTKDSGNINLPNVQTRYFSVYGYIDNVEGDEVFEVTQGGE